MMSLPLIASLTSDRLGRTGRLRSALVLLAVIGLLTSSIRPVSAAAEGVIEGQLQNVTAGAAVPGGVQVVLHIVDENDRVERRLATTDAEGRYRFDGLETAPGLKYLPLVEYQGAAYFPRPLALAEEPRQSADITVYEATTSDQWIAFERANLLVQNVAPNRLDLMEMSGLANVGDRSYVGAESAGAEQRPTLSFSVPAGALGLAPQAGFAPNDFSASPNGFTVASPVLPGRHQLAFSYSLPFSSQRFEIAKRLDYPAASFSLYVPDLGFQVQTAQLQPRGEADLGGQKYLVYSASNLPRGSELKINLVGLPVATASPSEVLAWPIIIIGSLALLVGLVLTYHRHQWRLAGGPDLSLNEHIGETQPEVERTRLLLTLARLDERYERGEVAATRYERERKSGKQVLVGLSQGGARTEAGVE